jgi:hypothetical protein
MPNQESPPKKILIDVAIIAMLIMTFSAAFMNSAVGAAIGIIGYIAESVLVFLDARSRKMRAAIWAFFAFVLPPIAIPLYFYLRHPIGGRPESDTDMTGGLRASTNKLSLFLGIIGLGLLAVSYFWWDSIFGKMGSGGMLDPLTCLYSSNAICELASGLSGSPAYPPLLFWSGLILLLVGISIEIFMAKK